jgi:hypothetical protein
MMLGWDMTVSFQGEQNEPLTEVHQGLRDLENCPPPGEAVHVGRRSGNQLLRLLEPLASGLGGTD